MKRLEYRVRHQVRAELLLNIGMHEQIHCAGDAQLWESLGAHARGFALVDERRAVLRQSVSNRGCLTVVKRCDSGAYDEFLEMPCGIIAKFDDVEDASGRQFLEVVAGIAPVCPPGLKFASYDIDDDYAVWQH